MARPPLEVADLIRAAGAAFLERNRHWLRWKHIKVLQAIRRCRTAALGGHLDECTRCGYRATISYAVFCLKKKTATAPHIKGKETLKLLCVQADIHNSRIYQDKAVLPMARAVARSSTA